MAAVETKRVEQAATAAANNLGFTQLKELQIGVIVPFVVGRDVFGILPTGYGKSLCYQCLPFIFDSLQSNTSTASIIVVVTPLTAIMKDQVKSLQKRGVRAAYIIGEPGDENMKEGVKLGHYQLVCFTPELLLDNKHWRRLLCSELYANLLKGFVVDEAHCVKKWGSTFRQSLLRIGELRSILPPGVNVMALTATASKSLRHVVSNIIGLRNPHVVAVSPCKPNIMFSVGDFDSVESLLPIVDRLRNERTKMPRMIIYTHSFAVCAQIYLLFETQLGADFLEPKDAPNIPKFRLADMFTSLTDQAQKECIIQNFTMQSQLRVVIATVAFGLGIDCQNVRQIVHIGMPDSLEDYIQETGRCGRDGTLSLATLLRVKREAADKSLQDYRKNKDKCRKDILFADVDEYSHVDMGSMCTCCDVCFKSCTCGSCTENTQNFLFIGEVKEYKVVKSGQIRDPDRLFKDLAAHVYPMYFEIGIELGLKARVLEDKLETGRFASLQGSKKALEMFQLWQQSITEDDLTYAVLAAALEKHGFQCCAHKYCYVYTGQLTVDDLEDIISKIEDARCKWKDIGLQLKIERSHLDPINNKFSDNPQKCLTETLTLWLRQGSSPATWSTLISVLKHPTVSFQQLAEEIESKEAHAAEQTTSAVGVHTESPKQETESGKQLYKCGYKNCPNKVEIECKKAHAAEQSTSVVGVQTESTEQETENGKQLYKCGCKNCPNKVEVGCSNPIPVNDTFPQISIYDGLSQDQREILKARLRYDSKKIMVSFHELLSSFYVSLTTREVQVKQLETHLLMIDAFDPVCMKPPTPLVQEHSELLASVTDIEGVIKVIKLYSSFFNYGILEKMIKYCGSPEDQTRMQEYKDEFIEYSRRMIYECPSYTGCEKKKGHMDMVMKLHSKYDSYPLSALQDLRIMLGEILHLNPETLHLSKIEEGCIRLSFQIPSFVYKATFPLSADQEKALLELSVLQLTSGDYHFLRKDSQYKTEHGIQHLSKVKSKDIAEKRKQYENDYRRALELGVVLSAYARVMFVGPGGVGKSSLLHGLMNKSIHAISASSTQLADTLTVKPVSYQWLSGDGTFCKEVTDNDELMELVGLVHLVAKASAGEIESPRFIEMMKETLSKAVRRHRQHPISKKDPESVQREIIHDILTQAVEIARMNPSATLPITEVLLLSWDCGGQSVFLDILPAFLTPRTVFLSVFDARRKLTDSCLIQSFKGGEVVAKQYHNASTLELILEWMASIHAMLGTRESSDTLPKFPRIIPVGTHGDDLDVKAKKEEFIANLSSEYQDKDFAHLVKKGVIVDNTTAGEGENEDPSFEYIRQQVHDLASKELAVPTPVSWVLFRRVFQKVVKASDSPIISLNLAKDIAIACNIPEETIPSMLQFYHDLAVFFHYTRVSSLKDRLIADPQWLVKEIAKLLALEGFESVNNPVLWKPLRERGVLVQPLYEEVWKGSKLPPQSLIDLLVYFKIAAPIVHKEYKFPGKEYYVPCVLPFFQAETATSLQLAIPGTEVIKQAATLHLLFNTHHVPPGYFTRLAISFSTDPKCRVLLRPKAYCNRISILYGDPECRIDQITLTKSKFSVKIDLARFQPRQSHHLSFASTCREVLKLLQNNSLSVIEWFPGVSVHMGFACEECPRGGDKNEHFVDISPEMSTSSQLYCTEFKSCTLTNAHLHWLNVSTKMLSLKGVPPVPEDAELQKLASEIQSKDKFKDVTDALEMNYHLECVGEDDPDAPVEVLRQWCSDMEEKDVHVRSHLVQHLKTAGLKEVAEKIKAAKYRKPTESSLQSHPQKLIVTKRELMSCSKFISGEQVPVLAKALSITASEEAHILSEFKQPDQQAYQMLTTWHTKAYNKSRQELLEVLEASDLRDAAKHLQKASQVPEMADLIKYVKAAFKWYTLGTHLGVENHKLKVIQEDNRNDSEAALLAVFQAWLDNTPDPSWSIVVKALKDTQLGVLASEISDRFCV